MLRKHLFLRNALILAAGISFALLLRPLFHTKHLNPSSTSAKISSPEQPNPQWMWKQRAYPFGKIPTGIRQRAWAHMKNNTLDHRSDAPLLPIGPTNIGGRITDIEISDDPNTTIYLGTASGGVFRSRDQGVSWQPIFDDNPVLPIGDIAIASAHKNKLYVGTGEPNAGGGSIAYEGNGVYISDDGGDTWQHAGLESSGSIGQVAIDPRDENRAFVAAMGPLYRKGEQRGIYLTEDGGKHWERSLAPETDSTGFIQVLLNPKQPDTVYAVAWERFKTTSYRDYGGPSSAIYRSIDGGKHWVKLHRGLPVEPGGFGRISLAIAPSQPNLLYALYLDETGFLYGLYTSSDGGDTWRELQRWTPGGISYNYWFGGLRVSPDDPKRVFRLGFYFSSSEDGGINWSGTDRIHVDQHAMAFFSHNPKHFLVGNDGGLYSTTDGGKSFLHFKNLPITQYYKIHIDPNDEHKIYCGAQDNNTLRTVTGSPNDFKFVLGGDGFQATVHPTNPKRVYAEYQYGSLFRSEDDADNFHRITTGIQAGEPANWSFPYVLAPLHPDVMYCGTNRVYRTQDGGDLWTPVSPRLSRKNYTGNQRFGTITSIDISPLDEKTIYAGTDDGKVWGTIDRATSWQDITANLPQRWVTSVHASTEEKNGVWVSLSGYRYAPNDGHVFYSECPTCPWENKTFDLPNVPVNDLEEVTGIGLFAATDLGVFHLNESNNRWENFTPSLPAVVVNDIEYYPASGYLYIGTYGRSGFKKHIGIETSTIDKGKESWTLNATVLPSSQNIGFTVEGDKSFTDFDVYLYDIKGQPIKHSTKHELSKSQGKYFIPLKGLTSGMYILTVHADGGVHSALVCYPAPFSR